MDDTALHTGMRLDQREVAGGRVIELRQKL
jgi:hypothetical protein